MSDTPRSPTPSGAGLLHSLQALAATLMAILQTRLDLLATELEQEKRRMLKVLAWGAVAVFMGCAGVLCLAALITVLFWDEHRVLVLALLTGAFWLSCGGLFWWIRQSLQAPADVFAGTLAELGQDQQALQPPPTPPPTAPQP